ncbi:MAG: hypothetical protein KatS3mg119_0964 [Rhodothalassiaceae bacterium]|nr:MAG: hypothetical protein KatS3mg119_0964 [Rhodothalassiaceae bacterium]
MTDRIETAARRALLIQRLALALFLLVWAVDKIVNPGHAAGVFARFYGIDIAEGMSVWIGVAEVLLVAAFALGLFKFWTYLAFFVFHLVSTVSSWKIYLALYGEGGNLLFWAAIPVLAAFWVQFALRDLDTLTLDDWLADRRAGRA